MPKIIRYNVNRKFEIDSKVVERIADMAINYQIQKKQHPLFSTTCKMIMAELASREEIISRMKPAVLNGLAKFIGDEVMKRYIWRKDGIQVTQGVN